MGVAVGGTAVGVEASGVLVKAIVGVVVGETAVGVEASGVLVRVTVTGVELAAAPGVEVTIALVNWIDPISNNGPRGWAKKSFEIPISAAPAAAGEVLPGR